VVALCDGLRMAALWFHAATLLLAVSAAVVVAWLRASQEVNNGFAQQRREVGELLERARLDMVAAHEALEGAADRAARERARIEQAERRAGGGRPMSAPARPYSDSRSYAKFLARGGARDRAFEQSLGWQGAAAAKEGA
jgi:HD superfamily phosphodiesterase